MDLTALDWILIAILLVSVVLSILKGFTRELISLVALVWGFVLACWFYRPLAARLEAYTRTPEVAALVAFLLIVLAVVIVGAVLSAMAGRLVKKAGLRWFDRLLGGAFGLVRGILAATIVVLVLAAFPIGPRPLSQSRLAPYVVQGARVIVHIAPAEMRERFRNGYERAREMWNARKDT